MSNKTLRKRSRGGTRAQSAPVKKRTPSKTKSRARSEPIISIKKHKKTQKKRTPVQTRRADALAQASKGILTQDVIDMILEYNTPYDRSTAVNKIIEKFRNRNKTNLGYLIYLVYKRNKRDRYTPSEKIIINNYINGYFKNIESDNDDEPPSFWAEKISPESVKKIREADLTDEEWIIDGFDDYF